MGLLPLRSEAGDSRPRSNRPDPSERPEQPEQPEQPDRSGRLRAGRGTNDALLWLLIGCLITGALVFAAAAGALAAVVVIAHGVLGLAVVALVPWKRVIVRRSRRSLVIGLILTVVVIICVFAGLWQTLVGFGVLGFLTPIQLHVGAALVIIPVLAWHVVARRRFHRRRIVGSRRDLLRGGTAAAAVVAGYAATAGLATVAGAQPRVSTGSRPLEPDQVPATIWLFDQVPVIDVDSHRVDVDGRRVGLAELEAGATDLSARLDCTSGWYADVRWSGHPLSELIDAAQLAAADSVVITSVTGYRRTFPVTEASALWLVVGAQGSRLTAAGGAPVRLVAPGRRGFWWVKWVASVRLERRSSWLQPPFPLQ